jgi:uroporphyrinogen III methyltransferase / synthase
MNKKGKVFLIGAGPGDAELITLKAVRVLSQADCIVYDSLANADFLDYAPTLAAKIYVGKRAHRHSKTQEEINKIIVSEAKRGRAVARLKGGDPFVFGRGGEEIEALIRHAIPYEIVPGVTSAIAVPAYAGIPVTHRSLSRSFAVVTGHLRKGEPIERLNMPVADTVVVLMGVENLGALVRKMTENGRFTFATPAALIQDGTVRSQKTVIGTLGTIEALRRKNRITAPAVLVAGDVAGLAGTMEWRSKLALASKRVVILRTLGQSYDLAEKLLEHGATVVKFPVISIAPDKKELDRISIGFLREFTDVVFTSPNGVALFFGRLHECGGDARLLAGKKVYCIGQKTAECCVSYGIRPDGVPKKFVAEGLLDILPESMSNRRVLLPRAAVARDVLPEGIRRRGGRVVVVKLYKTQRPRLASCPVEDGDYVVFTSSSTVQHFYGILQCRKKRIVAFSLGPVTTRELRRHTKQAVFTAGAATIDALVETIVAKAGRGA